MRKLASLVTIESVSPIENADRLEVATMVGKSWRVVTGKGDFAPGDAAVYFEIDSYLPNEERYAFLRERCLRKFVSKSGAVLAEGIRIKTVKLRGVVSQGLLMPVSAFPELNDLLEYPQVGADLTELLNIKHFDEVEEALRPQTGSAVAFDAYGSFPSVIPKTDEERIQNLADYFELMKGRTFEVTEKADGMSVTMFYAPSIDPENPFGVCSRNYRLKPETADGKIPLPWQMAKKYDVEATLRKLYEPPGNTEYAFQGELVGPGINGNRDLRTEHEWLIFRIYNITEGKFVIPAAARVMTDICKIPYVKVLEGHCQVFDEYPTFDKLMEFSQGKTDRGNEREGIVCKTDTRSYVSFKVVSNKYLLKGEK